MADKFSHGYNTKILTNIFFFLGLSSTFSNSSWGKSPMMLNIMLELWKLHNVNFDLSKHW